MPLPLPFRDVLSAPVELPDVEDGKEEEEDAMDVVEDVREEVGEEVDEVEDAEDEAVVEDGLHFLRDKYSLLEQRPRRHLPEDVPRQHRHPPGADAEDVAE